MGLGPAALIAMIVGGVLLLQRRPAGMVLHLVYAGLAAVHMAMIGWGATHFLFARCGQSVADAVVRWPEALGSIAGYLPYAVFVTVWFLHRPVRQQVRAWRTVPGRAHPRCVGEVWPTVIGVLSMAWAGRSVIRCQVTVTSLVAISRRAGTLGDSWLWAAAVNLSVTVLLSALLLAAGWMLLRRRRAGMVCHLLYGALAILWLLVAYAWWIGHAGLGGPLPTSMVAVMSILGALTSLAYPTFLLAWFLRPAIRAKARGWARAGR